MPRRPLVAALAAACLLVAGCGGSEADDSSSDVLAAPAEPATATDTTSPTPTPSPTATPRALEEPSADRGVELERVGGFEQPVYVTSPPGDRTRQLVVEQEGRVRVVRDGRVLDRAFLDLRDQVTAGGEQGLLSLAFAPDYAESGKLYVYFTDRDARQRVVEYQAASDDEADPGSARLLLRMADPEPNHNGGLLRFGPDGLLYVGTGDGGGGNDQHGPRGNAQDLGSLLGKVLRIDPEPSGRRPYTIPRSNPFVGRAGARGEVWAYGLRNPWRFSFDRRGQFVVADVGQDAVEEVSVLRKGRKGANFGWRPFEGRRRVQPGERAPGHVKPVIERLHDRGSCSITGGVTVEDPELPGLRGRYVFGDFCDGRLLSAKLSPGRARDLRPTGLEVEQLSSFGEDAEGRVYATSLSGDVFRLVAR